MATTTKVDLTKKLTTLKSEIAKRLSPEIQTVVGNSALNTGYKHEINPATFYTGDYDFSSLNAAPKGISTQSTMQDFGKPLGSAEANLSTPEGFSIKQLKPTGGRYAVDPNNPSRVIYDPLKDSRLDDYSDKAKAENAFLRGGLSSADVQIDHIMPLWLGGTDELANKRLLTKKQHDQKNKVETVARTLWATGKIDLDEARVLASTWENRDTDGIKIITAEEDSSKAGYLSGGVNSAMKKYDEWLNPKPKLKDYIETAKEFIFKKPVRTLEAGVGLPTTAATAAVANIFMPEGKKFDPLKEGVKYAEEVMAGKEGVSSQPIFSGFSSGTISGLTGGWINPEVQQYTGVDKTISDTASVAGNIVGTISSFIALKGLVGVAAKSTGLAGLAQKSSIGQKLLTGGDAIKGREVVVSTQKALKTLESIGLFGLHGQLSRQEEEGLVPRMERLMTDMASGAILGTAGQTWRGYSRVGVGTAALSYLEGADPKDAITNGIITMGLHSLGYPGRKRVNEKLIEQRAAEVSQDTRSRLLQYGRIDKTDPIEPVKVSPKAKTAAEIHQENAEIRKKIDEQITLGTYDQATGDAYMAKALVAGRELWKGGLSREAKVREDLLDLDSLGKKAKDPASINYHANPSPLVEYKYNQSNRVGEAKFDPLIGSKLPKGDIPTGKVWATATSQNIDKNTAKNIIRFEGELNSGLVKPVVYIVDRPELAAQIIDVNKKMLPADIVAGKAKPYANPQNNAQMFVEFSDGTMGGIGFVPREWKIEGAKLSQNERIRQLNKGATGDRPPMKEFDPKINKNSITQAMRSNGIKVLEVPLDSISSAAIESGQPYAIVNLTSQAWSNSLARNKGIKGISERQRQAMVETMKVRGVPASEQIKKMPISVDDGNLVSRGLVQEVMSKFTKDVESSIQTGDTTSLKRTIEDNFGPIIDDSNIKSFMSSKNKTVGDLMSVIDDGINKNPEKLSDNGKFWRDGFSSLEDDLVFLSNLKTIKEMPLEVNPFIEMKSTAPAVIKGAPKTVIKTLKNKEKLPLKVTEKPVKGVDLKSPPQKGVKSVAPSISQDLQRGINKTEESIMDITLSGFDDSKALMKKVDAYIEDFERDFHYRYKTIRDGIVKNKETSSDQKQTSLRQLDAVYNKKNLDSAKSSLRGRGESLAKQIEDEGRLAKSEEEIDKEYLSEASDDGWKKNTGKGDTFWGRRAKTLNSTGHTLEHLFTAEGKFPPPGEKSIRIDGVPYTFNEAVKVADNLIKIEETRAKGAPLLKKLLSNIKKPEAPVTEIKTGDTTMSSFWDRVRAKNPDTDRILNESNYETLFREDRQPKELMDWISSIRAKKYNELPNDVYKAFKDDYSSEMKSQEYIPTYPGSKIFKKLLDIWQKDYDPNKGEGSEIDLSKTASDIKEMIGTGRASIDEGKINVSTLDFFTDALAKIKKIKSNKVKEKAVEDLSRDMSQYLKTIKILPKDSEYNQPKFKIE